MKQIFYAIFCTVIIFPVTVNALVSPGQHGLVKEIREDIIIVSIIKFVISIIVSLAILMIVVSGIMYMTSGGDSGRTETAKKILTYSVVGLVVALLSYIIVDTIGGFLS